MKYLMITLFIFAVSFSSALTADFDCPAEVTQNVEFTCTLEIADAEGIYDFKLDLQKEGENIARVYNIGKDSFQSSFYYLKEFIEVGTKKDVRVIIEENGNLDGLIKLRKGSSTEQFNYSIKVLENETKANEAVNEVDKETTKKSTKERKKIIENNVANNTSENKDVNSEITGTIVLSASKGDIGEQKVLVYESKSSKIIRFSSYAFSLFLVILIFFLIRERV